MMNQRMQQWGGPSPNQAKRLRGGNPWLPHGGGNTLPAGLNMGLTGKCRTLCSRSRVLFHNSFDSVLRLGLYLNGDPTTRWGQHVPQEVCWPPR